MNSNQYRISIRVGAACMLHVDASKWKQGSTACSRRVRAGAHEWHATPCARPGPRLVIDSPRGAGTTDNRKSRQEQEQQEQSSSSSSNNNQRVAGTLGSLLDKYRVGRDAVARRTGGSPRQSSDGPAASTPAGCSHASLHCSLTSLHPRHIRRACPLVSSYHCLDVLSVTTTIWAQL